MSFLIICLASLALLENVAFAFVKPTQEWLDLYGKVFDFSKEGDPVKSSATLDMLKKLQNTGADWKDNRRMEFVGELIAANTFKLDQCNVGHLDHLNKLLEHSSLFPRTIVPYMEDQLINFAAFCQVQVANSLVETVESFDGEMKDRIDGIRKSVYDDQKSEFFSDIEAAAGLLKYLEDTQSERMRMKICDDNDEASRKKMRQFLSEELVNPCENIIKSLEAPLESYKLFAAGKNYFDRNVENWAFDRDICNGVVSNLDTLAERVYKLYTKASPETKHSIGTKLRKLVH